MKLPGLFAAFLLVFFHSLPAHAQSYSEILGFGDGLSVNGNVFATIRLPPPPYFQGRYSNGPVWVEYLAKGLGVPVPSASQTGGTNHAWGSAETGRGLDSVGVPNTGEQVSRYLSVGSPNESQLIVLWGGGNDFFAEQIDLAAPVANLSASISALAKAGGIHFMVPNLPPLTIAPFAFVPDRTDCCA